MYTVKEDRVYKHCISVCGKTQHIYKYTMLPFELPFPVLKPTGSPLVCKHGFVYTQPVCTA